MTDREHDRIRHRPSALWALGIFVAIAWFFLWEEHRAHLLGVLPWLLLLACPLLHRLMHRRHRHQHLDGPSRSAETRSETSREHPHGGHGCC